MISKLLNFLSNENIYLLANWGVIPFWLLLITAPRNIITNIFVHSIVPSIFLSAAYVLIAYNIFLNDNILDAFELYSRTTVAEPKFDPLVVLVPHAASDPNTLVFIMLH